MQASKIKVKSIYAIRAGNELQRFCVTAIVQRRIDSTGSPHDYQSHVEGFVVEHQTPGLGPHEQMVIKLHPDTILGPFEEFAELTQRRDAENAAAQAKRDAIAAIDLELRALLYQIVNEPIPNDSNDYKQLFRYSAGRVDISRDATAPLLNALKSLVRKTQEEEK